MVYRLFTLPRGSPACRGGGGVPLWKVCVNAYVWWWENKRCAVGRKWHRVMADRWQVRNCMGWVRHGIAVSV